MDISVKGLPPWNGFPKNIFIIVSVHPETPVLGCLYYR
jgi:hypothetical protein